MKSSFNYIYGPVESWRMGKSLGIDPLSDKAKICNLDCVYCQLGKTYHLSNKRKAYVQTLDVIEELLMVDEEDIDYITFSGRGEPTLASNLGEMIKAVKAIRKEEVAVITNSTLLHLSHVQQDLFACDYVLAKLDACHEISFQQIDQAMPFVSFEKTLQGIKDFQKRFEGTLALQIMFVEENRRYAKDIAHLAREINADEIQINTPLRPSLAKPLTREGMREIKSHFCGMPAVTVYEYDRKETIPLDEQNTIRRHGNYRSQKGELCRQ